MSLCDRGTRRSQSKTIPRPSSRWQLFLLNKTQAWGFSQSVILSREELLEVNKVLWETQSDFRHYYSKSERIRYVHFFLAELHVPVRDFGWRGGRRVETNRRCDNISVYPILLTRTKERTTSCMHRNPWSLSPLPPCKSTIHISISRYLNYVLI